MAAIFSSSCPERGGAVMSLEDNEPVDREQPGMPGGGKRPKVVFGYEDPKKNLVRNWSFQEPIRDREWKLVNASGERNNQHVHTGGWSLYLHDRTHKEGGIIQRIHGLKPDTTYYYSCFLKFPSHPEGEDFFHPRLFLYVKYPSLQKPKRQKLAILRFQRGPLEWQQFGSDFRTPAEEFEWIEPRLQVEPQVVDYYIDTVSLIELVDDPQWKHKMDKLIRKNRTSPVQINVNLPKYADPNEFTIKVRQTKREFAFGAAINADIFNTNEKYRERFLEHFEWAVFANHTKWKFMEGEKKGQLNHDQVDKAIEKLHERGVTVRGHTIHWNKMKSCPGWVHELRGEELQQEVDRRTRYVVELFKGRLVHWDVLNEHLHNRYLDERTGNHDQLTRICRIANEIDPECHLYINDYEVVQNGQHTSSQANLARRLLADGVPLHGLGAQSHLKSIPISITALKKRVEIAASAGLPVLMTEFTVCDSDVSLRAQALEEALYVYFSNPQVIGVITWTFWDPGYMGDDIVLFEGDDLMPNEAGEKLISLLNQWRTEELNLAPEKRRVVKKFRAYHGLHELEVYHNGTRVLGRSFKVIKDESLELAVDVEPEHSDACHDECSVVCHDNDDDDDEDDDDDGGGGGKEEQEEEDSDEESLNDEINDGHQVQQLSKDEDLFEASM